MRYHETAIYSCRALWRLVRTWARAADVLVPVSMWADRRGLHGFAKPPLTAWRSCKILYGDNMV